MPTAPSQTIPSNVVRRIRVSTLSNANGQPSAEALAPGASPNPAIASIAVSATDPTVVEITPGTSAGSVTLVVNKTSACPDPLLIPVTITAPANLGRVEFVEVVTPDVPKP